MDVVSDSARHHRIIIRRDLLRVVECSASRNEIELSDPIEIPPRKFFGQEITDAERRATVVVSSKC
jgi:hypothetical protein